MLDSQDRSARPLRDPHSFPHAAFFFPIVKRFAVDFVNGSFCHSHGARLPGHQKINVIDYAVGRFHIDTGEIFSPTEIGEPVVMDLHQIEREIFASIVDMKLLVTGFSAVVVDVPFNSGRDIGFAHFFCQSAARRRYWYCLCWQPWRWCSKPANYWLRRKIDNRQQSNQRKCERAHHARISPADDLSPVVINQFANPLLR